MTTNCPNSPEDPRFKDLEKIIAQHKDTPGSLIQVLHKAQNLFGYLPEEVQVKVSDGLNIPISEVYGVVTFYSLFTMTKKGKYRITVCLGTACYVKGAGDIVAAFKKELGIDIGDTTKDGLFTLDSSRCVGACGMAPVLTINEDVHGLVTKDDVSKLLGKYRNQAGVSKEAVS
ncbi:MAG: NADH-quinone oxidoreductase subunit NuoE family protein [Thermincolia bacterium]